MIHTLYNVSGRDCSATGAKTLTVTNIFDFCENNCEMGKNQVTVEFTTAQQIEPGYIILRTCVIVMQYLHKIGLRLS